MKSWIYIIIGIVCISCNEDEVRQQRVDKFYKYHSSDLLKNDSLIRHYYNPRAGFVYGENFEDQYRVYVRDSNRLDIITSGRFTHLDSMFGIIAEKPMPFFKKMWVYSEGDSLHFEVRDYNTRDTVRIVPVSWNRNPVEYYNQLKSDVKEYGLITFGSYGSGILNMHVTSYDYLVYIPDSLKLEKPEIGESYENRSNSIKLDDNWYHISTEEPLDLG